ncbi:MULTISPECIES: FkbM family methyltransferase [unclassified Mycolicibacterium]|uniref:FkbM family methyltransferase n=1 Tax=unclassified Mycolicibacterium TaxID=2636767 RepID=UPI002EDA4574
MLEMLKRALRRIGLYDTLRRSPLYGLYLRLFYPKLASQPRRELRFYRQALPALKPGDLIFDVGANDGFKTAIFLKLGARVVCVEPDRASVSVLRRRFSNKPVTIVPKAASDDVRTVQFHVAQPGSALNTLSDKWVEALQDSSTSRFGPDVRFEQSYDVQTVTVEQLMADYGRPSFLKIDVEGHELAVLRGLRQAVPLVSFELNLPEFRAEGLECVDILEHISSRTEFNHVIEDSFESRCWLSASEFRRWLEETDLRYLEVYARTSAVEMSSDG